MGLVFEDKSTEPQESNIKLNNYGFAIGINKLTKEINRSLKKIIVGACCELFYCLR